MKNNNKKQLAPLPLFDALDYLNKQVPPSFLSPTQKNDFLMSVSFLKAYVGSLGTFNSYRREIERLLHWTWMVAKKSLKDLKRDDMENFIRFCQKPPKSWIGIKKSTTIY